MAGIALLFGVFLFAVSTNQLGAQVQGAQLGVAVDGGSIGLHENFEAAIGQEVASRNFLLWNETDFPNGNDQQLLDGRDMFLSIRARSNGQNILWADIASAQPGDSLYQDMVDWADAIRPHQSQIWLTFHHEPEAGANIPNGDADDFIAAWRKFMTVLDNEGIQLAGRVWIATDFAFQLPPTDRRHPDKWYPGDQWVEAIGADVYNWHQCRTGINNDWYSARDIIEPIRDFGLQHPTEQMMITELGSVEDPNNPNRKANWITDAQALFKEPAYSQFTLVSYFNLHHDEGIFDCDWRIGTSTAATNAFAALANDPYYGGAAPTPAPTPTPAPAPAPNSCTAVRNGNSVTLNWNFTGNIIRRNGSWLNTQPADATTFTDTNAPTNATYAIRTRPAGVVVDTPCNFGATPTPAPASECTVAFNAAGANLTFNIAGTVQVRKNGGWLATASGSYVDPSGNAGDTYIARVNTNGGRIDYACAVV